MVLALVALGLQLLALVPYGIVRLSLLASERSQGLVAVISLVVADVLLIVYWSRALRRQRP
ncbi:MAG TPA: hypothetical protein DGR08_01210 [Synechococcales bacterium UBA12195]|nr:hypothetical protein [Synechococcales bacterium UBA12195]